MTTIESIRQMLGQIDSISLRFRPKSPEPIDNGLAVAKAFESLPQDGRALVLKDLAPSLGSKLLALSGFMAEAAINSGDAIWIRSAIVLHVIEDFGKDYRENFRYLILLAYAASKLNVNLSGIVDSVLPIASGRARNYLLDFSSRDGSLNNLASFGVKEEVVDNKSRFVPN
jgi:hypothetical protein